MKRFFSLRIVVWSLMAVFLTVGSVVVYGYRKITATLNSPGFHADIESALAKNIVGTARIEQLESRLGWTPWVRARNVALSAQDGRIRLDAQSLRFDVQWRPLLHGEVVFSRVATEGANLTLSRRVGEPWPSLETVFTKKQSSSRSIRIETILLNESRITFVDESVSSKPVLVIRADARIFEQPGSNARFLKLAGQFEGRKNRGQFEAAGRLAPALNIEIKVHDAPMQFLSAYAPKLSVIEGAWNARVLINKDNGTLNWSAQLASPTWTATHAPIPASLDVVVASSGSVHATVVWVSSVTSARVAVWSSAWDNADFQAKLNGSRLDVNEVLTAVKMGMGNTSSSGSSSSTFRVRAAWAMETVDVFGMAVPDVRGSLVFETKKGRWRAFQLQTVAGVSTATVRLDASRRFLDATYAAKHLSLRAASQTTARYYLTHSSVSALIQARMAVDDPRRSEVFSPQSAWSLSLMVHDAMFKEIPVHDMLLRAQWDGRVFQIDEASGGISSGTVTARARFEERGENGFRLFSTTAHVRDVEVGPVMFALSTHPVLLAGRMTADAQLDGASSPFQSDSLSGSFTLHVRKGYFRSDSMLLDIYSQLNLRSLFQSVSERKQNGLPFDVVAATAAISNGVAVFEQPAAVKSPAIEMMYTGQINCDLKNMKGVLVINPLVGSRNLLGAVPGISAILFGPNGEFLPVVVDVSAVNGKVTTNVRSIQTLAGPALRVIGNVLKLPATLFGFGKKKSE